MWHATQERTIPENAQLNATRGCFLRNETEVPGRTAELYLASRDAVEESHEQHVAKNKYPGSETSLSLGTHTFFRLNVHQPEKAGRRCTGVRSHRQLPAQRVPLANAVILADDLLHTEPPHHLQVRMFTDREVPTWRGTLGATPMRRGLQVSKARFQSS